jgi:hypothetical protein
MRPNRQSPQAKTSCIWCSVGLGSAAPKGRAVGFCSRRCEIEANFWLFQELCAIEITYPRWPEDNRNG